MNLLVLKLILTPLFVGGATLVARRFGPRVAGWLVALPLTSGPVAFYLALEQGTGFAARAAQATLLGLVSFAAFCLTYRWLSLRFGWLGCWLGSWSAFFITTFFLQQVSLPLPLVFISVMGVLLLTLRLLPDSQDRSRRCLAGAAWSSRRLVRLCPLLFAHRHADSISGHPRRIRVCHRWRLAHPGLHTLAHAQAIPTFLMKGVSPVCFPLLPLVWLSSNCTFRSAQARTNGFHSGYARSLPPPPGTCDRREDCPTTETSSLLLSGQERP